MDFLKKAAESISSSSNNNNQQQQGNNNNNNNASGSTQQPQQQQQTDDYGDKGTFPHTWLFGPPTCPRPPPQSRPSRVKHQPTDFHPPQPSPPSPPRPATPSAATPRRRSPTPAAAPLRRPLGTSHLLLPRPGHDRPVTGKEERKSKARERETNNHNSQKVPEKFSN